MSSVSSADILTSNSEPKQFSRIASFSEATEFSGKLFFLNAPRWAMTGLLGDEGCVGCLVAVQAGIRSKRSSFQFMDGEFG